MNMRNINVNVVKYNKLNLKCIKLREFLYLKDTKPCIVIYTVLRLNSNNL